MENVKKNLLSDPLQITIIAAIIICFIINFYGPINIPENIKIMEISGTDVNMTINLPFSCSRIIDIPSIFFMSCLFVYFKHKKKEWFSHLPKSQKTRPWDNYVVLIGIFILGLTDLFGLPNVIPVAITIITIYIYLNLDDIDKKAFSAVELAFALSIGISIKNSFLLGLLITLLIIIFILVNIGILTLLTSIYPKKEEKQS